MTKPILQSRALAIGVSAIAAISTSVAQDDAFVNLETPHVKPIASATISGGGTQFDLILVCNSADNSVEIYDALPPHTFYQRVPVGVGPATVRWNAALGNFYTCNFDGDTVSVVSLDVVMDSNGALVPFGSLEGTTFVGDQPADIAFEPNNTWAWVTLSGKSSSVIVDPNTLATLPGFNDLLLTADEVNFNALTSSVAAKAPRQNQILPDGRAYALNFAGGNPNLGDAFPFDYDVDLWFNYPAQPTGTAANGRFVGAMGTTNEAFAINSRNDLMVVVGTLAQNRTPGGEAAVAALPFGFVESRVWVVDLSAGGAPLVRMEDLSGLLPSRSLPSFNLNRDYTSFSPTAVTPALASSQPSDVVLLEDANGDVDRIVMTAFHSDKVVLLTPDTTVLGGYTRNQVSIPVLNPAQGYSTSGPSGITAHPNTNLLYVTCRLDSTLRVIDPATNTLSTSIQLNNDPTPTKIRRGREFLYNANVSSTSGMVSCASCHLNGTTDGLAWDLSDGSTPMVPPQLESVMFPAPTGTTVGTFPGNKGPLVTQTLQGLVNSVVNADSQYLFSNAPYHWRGDRAGFQAFNPAFVALLGRSSQLTPLEMFTYTDFINTVRYPPNPEQSLERVVAGTLGPNPDDPLAATGAKLGLQMFHNLATDGFACADCHTLPEGSDNVLTEIIGQPLETAQMRGLVAREFQLQRNNLTDISLPFVSNHGLTHDGAVDPVSFATFGINWFVRAPVFTYQSTGAEEARRQEAMTAFSRQFDTGLARSAGGAYTVIAGDPNNALAFSYFERQTDNANSGLAAIARDGSSYRGFWYDNTAAPAVYREEGTTTTLTRAQVEALATGANRTVVLQGTHLGNARRAASLSGVKTALAGAAPSNVTGLPMAPMTFYTDIPQFVNGVNIDAAGNVTTPETFSSRWSLRTLQANVLGNFGVSATPHQEPPRRFRVTGDNIRPGARLVMTVPTTQPGLPGWTFTLLDMPIFSTGQVTAGGDRIWETDAEMGPIATFAMLNGGPSAPGVIDAVFRTGTTPALQANLWNQYVFSVVNEDGTVNNTFPLAPLTVQDTR